jgi:predicted enzyme related to lactoylglutathione lyase
VTTATSHISTINLVVVPVTDQDRAVEFYEAIGMEKRTDIPFGNGYRWVEVYPATGTTGIALAPPPPDSGTVGVQTGISLATDDIDASHQHLKAIGADVDDEVSRMGDPVPPLFMFRDPDGNTLMVVQPSES